VDYSPQFNQSLSGRVAMTKAAAPFGAAADRALNWALNRRAAAAAMA